MIVEKTGPLGVVVLTEGHTQFHLLPPSGQVFFGRAADIDIIVDDSSVSRRHAVIHSGDPATLEDLGSRNGTRLGGQTLEPNTKYPIAIGSVIEVGNVTVIVQRGTTTLADAELSPRSKSSSGKGLIVRDKAMQQLYQLVDVVAPANIPVLILGETGVGKEVFAQEIHRRSARADKAFLTLNCAALPESILESELFGHEKGSFTGAIQTKMGLFESADGGTVFLDEVGELPPTTQAKLLRVLECGEVMRIGALRPRVIDVRFISATNRDLEQRVAAEQFRADLFFRLNGMTVRIPRLAERPDDIDDLVRLFAERACTKMNRPAPRFSPEALDDLRDRDWPGNIRELRNVIERAVLLAAKAGEVLPEHLGSPIPPKKPVLESSEAPTLTQNQGPTLAPPPAGGLRADFESYERKRIIEALELCAGNQSRAAKMLEIGRRTLIRRIDAYGIPRPRAGRDDRDDT
jgi:transcriptional regulator with GAF, ATPase, and Fis domain